MKKRMSVFLLVALIAAVCFLGASCSKKINEKKVVKKDEVVNKKPIPKIVYCPLCGAEITGDAEPKRPMAVMVENLKSVRPQCGLGEACVVVEALAEGGITRFLAVYADKDSGRIGPVRSARNHYVAIARGMNALLVHCGGSKFAMRAISDWGVADLDQMKKADAFWRTKEKAPHNLWTSTYKVRSAAKVAGYGENGDVQGFRFKSDAQLEVRPEKQNIAIDFSGKPYRVEYQYKRDTNTYRRINGGVISSDRISGKELEPKNVVIVFAPTSGIAGGGEVLDVQVVGRNKCLVFRDGKVTQGSWEKTDEKEPFHVYDGKMEEIPLNRGQTWIELVKANTNVTYDQGEVKTKK